MRGTGNGTGDGESGDGGDCCGYDVFRDRHCWFELWLELGVIATGASKDNYGLTKCGYFGCFFVFVIYIMGGEPFVLFVATNL